MTRLPDRPNKKRNQEWEKVIAVKKRRANHDKSKIDGRDDANENEEGEENFAAEERGKIHFK